jgi:hypothetical protein
LYNIWVVSITYDVVSVNDDYSWLNFIWFGVSAISFGVLIFCVISYRWQHNDNIIIFRCKKLVCVSFITIS